MLRTIRTIAAWIPARADLRGARGATAIEYAIVASAIAAVVVLAVGLLGGATSANFDCAQESWETRAEAC